MALHGVNLIIARQLVVDVERFMDRTQIRVVPPLCPLRTQPVRLLERRQADRARRRVARATGSRAAGSSTSGIPHELPPHAHDVI